MWLPNLQVSRNKKGADICCHQLITNSVLAHSLTMILEAITGGYKPHIPTGRQSMLCCTAWENAIILPEDLRMKCLRTALLWQNSDDKRYGQGRNSYCASPSASNKLSSTVPHRHAHWSMHQEKIRKLRLCSNISTALFWGILEIETRKTRIRGRSTRRTDERGEAPIREGDGASSEERARKPWRNQPALDKVGEQCPPPPAPSARRSTSPPARRRSAGSLRSAVERLPSGGLVGLGPTDRAGPRRW